MTLIGKQTVDPAWGDFARAYVSQLHSSQDGTIISDAHISGYSKMVVSAFHEEARTTIKPILPSILQHTRLTLPATKRKCMNILPAGF
jgi:hypothetical protein